MIEFARFVLGKAPAGTFLPPAHADGRGGLPAFLIAFLLLAASSVPAAEPQKLSGHVPRAVSHLQSSGALAETNRLRLAFGLPLRNREALTNLLEEIGLPGAANYRRHLTPEQFTEQFGPTAQDYQSVVDFARAAGLTVTTTHPNRLLVSVEGSVADIQRALHVKLRLYPHPKESRQFFAPDTEPSLDLATPVLRVSGLDNFTAPHPKNLRRSPGGQAVLQVGVTQPHPYIGSDFRNAYAPGVTLTGTGQSVGLFELDGYYAADIASYVKQAGLPAVPVSPVLIDGYDGVPAGPSSQFCCGNEEVALDIEMAISMAPGLSKVLVYEGTYNNPTTAMIDDVLNRMATDNLAKQLSCSWGFDIDETTEQIFQEYALQGQTFFLASGDSGAFTPVVAQPSDNPYITVVGGTTLTLSSSGSWISEQTWNDTTLPGGSSGGISTVFPIPSWQQGISMAASQGSIAMRNVPDVSMVASNVLVWADNGQYGSAEYEGTSIASPLWASFTALANEQAAASGQPPVGFLNPALYSLAKGPSYKSLFHDITVGTAPNINTPSVTFSAVPGYDLVTGWGSPVGMGLISALIAPPVEPLVVSPLLGFTAFGPVGGPFNVASETYTLTNIGAAQVQWSVVSTSSWLNVSSSGGVLSPGGPSANVVVGLNAAATNLLLGNYSANVVITDTTSGASQVVQFNLASGNGGFETGDLTDWTLTGDSAVNQADSQDYNYQTGSDLLPGVDDSLFVHSGIYGGFLGQATTLGHLSQTVPTVAGQRYVLSFWLANPAPGTPNQFTSSWNGAALFDQSDLPQLSWTNVQYVVTATGSSSVIDFGFRNDQNAFALDDVSLLPVPSPSFQLITRAGGLVSLVWNVVPGFVYQLQSTSDLSAPVWASVGPPLAATSATLTATDTPPASGGRFYRIQLTP